jgi:hypothetical protein
VRALELNYISFLPGTGDFDHTSSEACLPLVEAMASGISKFGLGSLVLTKLPTFGPASVAALADAITASQAPSRCTTPRTQPRTAQRLTSVSLISVKVGLDGARALARALCSAAATLKTVVPAVESRVVQCIPWSWQRFGSMHSTICISRL